MDVDAVPSGTSSLAKPWLLLLITLTYIYSHFTCKSDVFNIIGMGLRSAATLPRPEVFATFVASSVVLLLILFPTARLACECEKTRSPQ